MDREKIIYSINIEDVQNVADQELVRELTEDESTTSGIAGVLRKAPKRGQCDGSALQ